MILIRLIAAYIALTTTHIKAAAGEPKVDQTATTVSECIASDSNTEPAITAAEFPSARFRLTLEEIAQLAATPINPIRHNPSTTIQDGLRTSSGSESSCNQDNNLEDAQHDSLHRDERVSHVGTCNLDSEESSEQRQDCQPDTAVARLFIVAGSEHHTSDSNSYTSSGSTPSSMATPSSRPESQDHHFALEAPTNLTDESAAVVARSSGLGVAEPLSVRERWQVERLAELCIIERPTEQCETCGLYKKPASDKHCPLICAAASGFRMRFAAALSLIDSDPGCIFDDWGNSLLMLSIVYWGNCRHTTHVLLEERIKNYREAFSPNNFGLNPLFVCIEFTQDHDLFQRLLAKAPVEAKRATLPHSGEDLYRFAQSVKSNITENQRELLNMSSAEKPLDAEAQLEIYEKQIDNLETIIAIIAAENRSLRSSRAATDLEAQPSRAIREDLDKTIEVADEQRRAPQLVIVKEKSCRCCVQ